MDWRGKTNDYKVEIALPYYIYRSQLPQVAWRVVVYALLMFSIYLVLAFNFGFPVVQARGELSYMVFWITTSVDAIVMRVLLFLVFHATMLFLKFAKGLGDHQTSFKKVKENLYGGINIWRPLSKQQHCQKYQNKYQEFDDKFKKMCFTTW